jgi:hypothetical protein
MACIRIEVAIKEFSALQGALAAEYIRLRSPKDLARFRDAENGKFQLEGKTWIHQRHGAGISFTDPSGVRINAHVAMALHPHGFDEGRIWEYLESTNTHSVEFENLHFDLSMTALRLLFKNLVEAKVIQTVQVPGQFSTYVYELTKGKALA